MMVSVVFSLARIAGQSECHLGVGYLNVWFLVVLEEVAVVNW